MFIDIIERKNHILRRLYSRFFGKKHAALTKKLVIRFLYKIVHIEDRLRSCRTLRYKLVSVSDYAHKEQITCRIMMSSSLEVVPSNKFYKSIRFPVQDTSIIYQSLDVILYKMEDVVAMARTEFIFKNDLLIHPDSYDPKESICTIEQFDVGKILYQSNSALIRFSLIEYKIEYGISLLGEGSGNYAHFLTEIIPKLLLIDSTDEYDDCPLIVDGWIGEPLLHILHFFNSKGREILPINVWSRVMVKRLLYISSVTRAPQDFRVNYRQSFNKPLEKIPTDSYLFSGRILAMVRDYALSKCTVNVNHINRSFRIYLRRKPVFKEGVQYNLRCIKNEHEIITSIKKYNFEVIDITALSFESQVRLIASADIIIAPLGAVMTNMIFARPNSTIIGLGAFYKNANYSYYSNMMAALGHELYYVVGHQHKDMKKHPMHRDYYIPIECLNKSLKKIIG